MALALSRDWFKVGQAAGPVHITSCSASSSGRPNETPVSMHRCRPCRKNIPHPHSPFRTGFMLSRLNNNDNNTFTWSRPSGVLDCTLRMPEGHWHGWYSRNSFAKMQVAWHRWSLEPTELPGGENLRGGKRLRRQVSEGLNESTHVSVDPNRPLIASLQLCSHVV
jgi:hypothetical protein